MSLNKIKEEGRSLKKGVKEYPNPKTQEKEDKISLKHQKSQMIEPGKKE